MDLVWSAARGLSVVGPNTTAFLAPLPANSAALGVRLHPGCAPSLLGVSAEALRDGAQEAAGLWQDEGKRLEARWPVQPTHAPGALCCSIGWGSAPAPPRRPTRWCARQLGA